MGYRGRGEVRSSDQPKTPATEVYPDIALCRSLMLSREYLFDVYAVADKGGRPRQYHWLVHAPGVVSDENPWRDSTELQDKLMNVDPNDLPKNDGEDARRQYRIPDGPKAPPAGRSWIRIGNEKKVEPGGKPLSITVLQSCVLPDVAQSVLGKEWYDRKIGVRIRMLGEEGTAAFAFDTPVQYPPGAPRSPRAGDERRRPETGGVSIAVARKSPATLFVALHEPFQGSPRIEEFRRIGQTADAVAAAIVGPGMNDRVMVRLGKVGEPATLAGEGESFTFDDHAFVRIGADKVEVAGDLRAMAIRVTGHPKLVRDGKASPATISGGLMKFGD